MNKSDLETLVDIRVSEANVLLESEKYQGSYYLAGYALECSIESSKANDLFQAVTVENSGVLASLKTFW